MTQASMFQQQRLIYIIQKTSLLTSYNNGAPEIFTIIAVKVKQFWFVKATIRIEIAYALKEIMSM